LRRIIQTYPKQFSLFERFAVVAIILLVAVIATQNILFSVRASEERSLNNATVEYAGVKICMQSNARQFPEPGPREWGHCGQHSQHAYPLSVGEGFVLSEPSQLLLHPWR